MDPANRSARSRSAFPHGCGGHPRLRAVDRAACWSPTIGGPSVKPYQPDGVWEAVGHAAKATPSITSSDTGDEALSPQHVFVPGSGHVAACGDGQSWVNDSAREVSCTVRRERTNTPLQALVTLNDIQFIEAARHVAQLVLRQVLRLNQRNAGSAEAVRRRRVARPIRACRGWSRWSARPIDDKLLDVLQVRTRTRRSRPSSAQGESQGRCLRSPPADLAAMDHALPMLCSTSMRS